MTDYSESVVYTCNGQLMSDFISKRNCFLFSVYFLDLHPEEKNLNAGRFACFSPNVQSYFVQKILPEFNTTSNLNSIFDWLGDNVCCPWNVFVTWSNLDDINLMFSFSDKNEAIIFKLLS